MPAHKNDRNNAPRGSQPTPKSSNDAFFDALAALYSKWVFPYSWKIAILLVAALLVVALVRGLLAQQQERKGAGFAALSKAEDADSLLAVARDHDGTVAGVRAQIQAAGKLYEDGKYDQAATKFALAQKSATDDAGRLAATLGEAYAVEADGKPEAAEKTFAEIAGATPSKAVALDAWLGAGRCAKVQGKLAEAEKYYGRAEEAGGEDAMAQRRVTEAKNALAAARYASRIEEPAADATETSEAATDPAKGTVASPKTATAATSTPAPVTPVPAADAKPAPVTPVPAADAKP